LFGEAGKIRQFDRRRAVERQHWRGHLIGHDEKNILALHVIAAFHSEYLCDIAAIEHGVHALSGKARAGQ
jgi:L-alanine-DL-glutamate epimerase-like enolase superfamily enzyme